MNGLIRSLLKTFALSLTGLVLACVGTGCASSKASHAATSTLPRNLYREIGGVPGHVKRIAVLPMYVAGRDFELEDGRAALQPLLIQELVRSGKFEFVAVSPEQLRQWVGAPAVAASDTLPAELLASLRAATSCDGVLFAQLTRYRAYPPVAVGWRMQVLTLDPVRVLWAVDELFDGSDPEVADGARGYYRTHFATPTGADPQSILSSPRRFGQYTASLISDSLPQR